MAIRCPTARRCRSPSRRPRARSRTSNRMIRSAADLGVPPTFNAATHFVDRHIGEGRRDKVAIECGSARITYGQLFENVNRCGRALRDRLDVRVEERVLMLMLDGPEFAYAFFGGMKIGAVPVPTNTLLKPADYRHLLEDSGATVLIVSAPLLPLVQDFIGAASKRLRHVVVAGGEPPDGCLGFDDLLASAASELEAEPTSRD